MRKAALLLAPFLAAALCASGQETPPGPLKAAFLFRFTQYVEWPETAFESETAPFVLGVIGRHPFGSALSQTVRGETVQGRRVDVTYFTGLNEITNCHVLYVSDSEWANVDRILALTRNRPILTVSDLELFGRKGGIIRFLTNTRVRFRINLDAAREAKLTISSRLLRLAETVESTAAPPK